MYNTGMAYTSPACLGLALARPDLKVVAIEGDGAMLMGLPNFVTIGRYLPKNLVVLVINNRVYRGTGPMELASATAMRADLGGFARAAGVPNVTVADDVEEVEEGIERAMAGDGPSVVIANVDQTLILDPESGGAGPDRTDLSLAFQRWLREVRPPPASAVRPAQSEDASGPIPERLGAYGAAGRVIYDALKRAGVNFFVYLPETVLYSVQVLAEQDPEMLTVCCTREDEGIAIASGAAYAGRLPALVVEGTGVGLSGLILASTMVRRAPVLILGSHSQVMGIRQAHDNISAMVNEPILHSLNIPCTVLTHLSDARVFIRESARSAQVLKSPVGVAVPPYVMDEADPLASGS
jgi:thiamine pyrophosphate-dependent acetolactate synthase large subunit-like protein